MEFFAKILKVVLGLLVVGAVFWLGFTVFVDEPVFGPEQDVELGRQAVESIEAEPEEYPLLEPDSYPEAYAQLRRIVGNVLQSDAIVYRDTFAYNDVRIIHDDEVLNAFCTPGGFVFVYSGLIKYLDSEDHLAGVLGHEIAHAERRHSSIRMQKQYGAQQMFKFLLLSTPMTLREAWAARMLGDLLSLDYSRDQEAEADTWSVSYLEDTDYACDGTAGFFEKLTSGADQARIPEFLSDHPDPEARIRDIRREAQRLGCSTQLSPSASWPAFQASLP